MEKLTFMPVEKGDAAHRVLFESLFLPYTDEQRAHNEAANRNYIPHEMIGKWFNSIIDMQGPSDRHLEVAFDDEKPVGFLYGKVDHAEQRGFIKPGFGYIMEFYVVPEYRRQGVGTQLFRRLEALFANDRAAQIYLTADPVTGEPFWEAMGFKPNGEISPETNTAIYVKNVLALTPIDESNALSAFNIYHKNLEALQSEEISLKDFKAARLEEEAGTDERNFLITRGALPLAWLKINGLDSTDTAWISMLAVEPEYHRKGVGTFAVTFAENYARSKGISSICLQTSIENTAANALYKKLGYLQSKTQIQGRVFYEKRLSTDVKISAIPVGDKLTDCSEIIAWAKAWDWGVGEILAHRLENKSFSDWETAFLAAVDGENAGLCVLEKTDSYGTDISYSPFITTVYVDPKFRGRRLTEKLSDAACGFAKSLGFSAVYLISNEHGLYEKFGFEKFTQTVTIFGGTEPVYRKLLR